MQQETEIPDIRFWGLKVAAGKPATYSIENDQGMLELCHLTNVALGDSVALVNASTAPKPIYVRVRSPDAADEYTLGALVPGRIYSFSTDLMITPDTEFSHTGAAGEEVHLTGYRCVIGHAHCCAIQVNMRPTRSFATNASDPHVQEFQRRGDVGRLQRIR